MDTQVCACCSNPFEKKGRNYLRKSIHTAIHGKTVIDVLKQYGIVITENKFVCHPCFNIVNRTAGFLGAEEELESRTNQSLKRKNYARTPVKTSRKIKKVKDVGTSPFASSVVLTPKRLAKGWKSEAICAIQKSKFDKALRCLMNSRSFQRAFTRSVCSQVRQETQGYAMCAGRKLSENVSSDTISSFSWNQITKELKDHLPVVHASLTGTLTSHRNVTSKLGNFEDGFGTAVPVMGMVFAQLLYNRFPKKFNFVQELCALEMWTSGCSQKMFHHFQRLGRCKGIKGAMSSVDRFRKDFDKEVRSWKTQIEESEWPAHLPVCTASTPGARTALFLDTPSRGENDGEEGDSEGSDEMLSMMSESTSTTTPDGSEELQSETSASLADDESDIPSDGETKLDQAKSEEAHNDNKGFCLVWDNVQLMSTVRHQTSEKQNKMLLWALCFGVKNRIGFRYLVSKDTKRAQEIPIQEFLPNDDDYLSLKQRMIALVQRILKTHLQAFVNIEIPLHIEHQYSRESRRKSRVVNMGVLDVNPSSTAGVISIMDKLQTYVPHSPNGKELFVIPCHGDGLSIERMGGAKAARSAAGTKPGRLQGLEPVPQEFHKQMILTQDTMCELYKPSSGADRGTLFHIRNTFNHRNVKNSVAVAYNAISDLLQFTTEGLVALLAVKLLDMEDKNDQPGDMPADERSQRQYLEQISARVVEEPWTEVPRESVTAVVDAEDIEDDEPDGFFQFCFCKEDTGDGMLVCSNHRCGRWFHLTCVNLTEDAVPDGDWWCSKECQDTKHSPYCLCKRYQPGLATTRCKSGDHCVGGQYYHLACLSRSKKPAKTWLCEGCKEKKGGAKGGANGGTKTEDHVYQYTKVLQWKGLQHLARRDAIRENDGPALISHWRLDMPEFWRNKHNKYLTLGHKTLADVSGFQPARLQSEIIWNRTANVKGGAGHNIPLDLLNELLNKDFKENLKSRRGVYTEDVVARASQFVGTLSKDLEKVFQKKVSGKDMPYASGRKADFRTDVGKFVEEYKDDNLFQVIPGREHSAFPKFKFSPEILKPEKLKSKLKHHSVTMDVARDILP